MQQAWLHVASGHVRAAEEQFARAEALAAADHAGGAATDRVERGALLALGAHLALVRQRDSEAGRMARRALETLPPDALHWRSVAGLALGHAEVIHGNLYSAETAYRGVAAAAWGYNDAHVALVATAGRGSILEQRGHLREAHEVYGGALGRVAGALVPAAGYAEVGLGRIACEWDDLRTAQARLERAVELAEEGNLTQVGLDAHLGLLLVRRARGDEHGAERALAEAERLARLSDLPTLVEGVDAWRALGRLGKGETEAAVAWADRQDDSHWPEAGAGPVLGPQRRPPTALARVWLASGQVNRALAHLDLLIARTQPTGQHGLVLEMLALWALAEDALGRRDQALGTLRTALEWGEPDGYRRVFLDLGPPMEALLREAFAQGESTEYVRRLLSGFAGSERAAGGT